MRFFSRCYEKVMQWSLHRRAPVYLGVLSFAESSFFPIPPDVMLAPMVLARPERAAWLAAITTVASVLGGFAGFAIGVWGIDAAMPFLQRLGYDDEFARASDWFMEWGFWAVLAAGFSPIPYKVFTIAAGALAMNLPAFAAASLVGRGSRFFLVATLVAWGGPRVEAGLKRYVDVIGWALVALLLVGYFLLRD